MSKIIKHTFELPNLKVVNGNIVEDGIKKETYTFTLLIKGLGIYEEMANEPLVQSLMKIGSIDDEKAIANLMNTKFIKNLASASYVKIEGDKMHNNRATAEEFKKLSVCEHLDDLGFILKLIEMATDCVVKDKDRLDSDIKSKKGHVQPKK